MKKLLATFALAATLAIAGTALSATPVSLTTPKAQAVTYTKCTGVGMDGSYYCYQSGCTWWQWTFNNCRDGWVRFNVWSS